MFNNSFSQEISKVVIESERLQTIFDNDQLLYVSNSNVGFDTLTPSISNNSPLIDEIKHNPSSEKEFVINEANLKQDYENYSYYLLLYMILIFIVAQLSKSNRDIIFSFSIEKNRISSLTILTVIVVTSFFASLLIDFDAFNNLFLFLTVYFLLMFVIGQFVENYFTKDNLLNGRFIWLFKLINLIFCFYVSAKMFDSSNVIFPISQSMLIVLIVFVLTFFSAVALLNQFKKSPKSYIFYYLCAFEILPALILKAIIL